MPTPGPLELVAVLVIALIVLGPGKLPDVGTALGKSIREFRKATTDIQEAARFDTPLTQAVAQYAATPSSVAAPASAPVPAQFQPVATDASLAAAASSPVEPAR
jgi:TatA/E family protein of Tat protein translocase